jgi:hypothetical protein
MFRTIFTLGVFALLGLILLSVVFKILGGVIKIVFALLGVALQVAVIGGIAYLVIRIVSPNTAAKIRAAFTGNRLNDGW